jgi:hypothetical protein
LQYEARDAKCGTIMCTRVHVQRVANTWLLCVFRWHRHWAAQHTSPAHKEFSVNEGSYRIQKGCPTWSLHQILTNNQPAKNPQGDKRDCFMEPPRRPLPVHGPPAWRVTQGCNLTLFQCNGQLVRRVIFGPIRLACELLAHLR